MSGKPRPDSDRARAIALLATPMTNAQLAEAAGWQSHRASSTISMAVHYGFVRAIGTVPGPGRGGVVNVYQAALPVDSVPLLERVWPARIQREARA